ncbi:hypothetical protein D9758_010903 [Tetrapyrgos nigripes]|uniref:feruloyl esterase n=1 Tax=Tetrapyrgos nigripes TaxID=182062 RepID=A0A8H5CUN9_9AGAR|nr:hypothetical protein D9758_010903 [Tetrapyrgos nigripes]
MYHFLIALGLIMTSTFAAPTGGPSGCGKQPPSGVSPGGASSNRTLTSGDQKRSYLIHLPQNYDSNKPTPLILSFHGRTQTAKQQEDGSQFSNPSFNPDGIAVYPQGVDKQWQGDPDAPKSIDDFKFVSDLLDRLNSEYCIDPKRIYATGMSNGGGFTGLLACDPTVSAKIAAFSTVSGAFYLGVLGAPSNALPDCKPARTPIPLLHFHGYVDTQIKYLGGGNGSNRGNTTSIPDYLDRWAKIDGIQPDQNPEDLCDGKVKRHSWGNGILQHYNETLLNHEWPTKSNKVCYDGAQVIMEFFGKHTL